MGDSPADDSELDHMFGPAVAKNLKKKRPPPPGKYPVHPENWTAAQLFLACIGSCWEYAPMSGRILGFKYTDVDVVINRGGFEPFDPEDWRRLQMMESIAKTEMNRIADSRR